MRPQQSRFNKGNGFRKHPQNKRFANDIDSNRDPQSNRFSKNNDTKEHSQANQFAKDKKPKGHPQPKRFTSDNKPMRHPRHKEFNKNNEPMLSQHSQSKGFHKGSESDRHYQPKQFHKDNESKTHPRSKPAVKDDELKRRPQHQRYFDFNRSKEFPYKQLVQDNESEIWPPDKLSCEYDESGTYSQHFQYDEDNEFLNEEKQCLIKWFEDLPKSVEDFKPLLDEELNLLRDEARVILSNDTEHYRNKSLQGAGKSNSEWLHTMMTRGTSRDKLAASVVLIQNSPVHSLSVLRNLISLVNTSKKECVKAMEVLTDLFISDLLVSNRKLRFFEQSPLSCLAELSGGNAVRRKTLLKLWYFEDQLKREYQNFVDAVRNVGHDTLKINKEKSIVALQKLLSANPEHDTLMLAILVNKMGDTAGNIASKALYCLKKTLEACPFLKSPVMKEIEKLMFRPNVGAKAQYYCVCFLTQFVLNNEEPEVACKLIELYFSFFKALVKSGDVDSRMMSALLTGVNRAYPFARKGKMMSIKDHVDTLYKIVHLSQFNIGIHALSLLFQVNDYDSGISDRFYSVLYQKLLDPGLYGSSHHASFISLVFRSLSKDLEFNRVKVFVKRLLQICHFAPVPLAVAILVMISHLIKKNIKLKALVLYATQFNDAEDGSGDEHYVDIKMEEEEPNKSLKLESSNANGISIIKEDKKPVTAAWYHAAQKPSIQQKQDSLLPNAYARNPLFVKYGVCAYTELVSLSTHFHPTVSLFASRLLEGANIEYTGDPLADFTLTRFLDRWVFKNPKQLQEKPQSKFSRHSNFLSRGVKAIAVNSEQYLETPESRIPSDELFLYRFLKQQQSEGRNRKQTDEDDDIESISSEDFNGMMDQLMSGKECIDYSEEMKPAQSSEKKKKKKGQDEDEDSMESENEGDEDFSDLDDNETVSDMDEDDDGGGSDIDYNKVKEEFSDLDEIDDENEVMEFGSDGEEDFEFTMSDVERDEEDSKRGIKRKKSLQMVGKRVKKPKRKETDRVFAPAEEFAELLENTGEEMVKLGSLANVNNKDNAGIKQLKWERARNHWIQGKNDKRKRKNIKAHQPHKKRKR